MLNVAVLLVAYNRPELAAKTAKAIARARPSRVLVAIDSLLVRGTRPPREDIWDAIVSQGFSCPVSARFQQVNMGCARHVVHAIDWAFSCTDELIVLEDDCLPHDDFFDFCAVMLERYRHDTRVMHIGGANLVPPSAAQPGSYYLSPLCLPAWGWATWKRAWKHFQFELPPPAGARPVPRSRHAPFWQEILEQNQMAKEAWDLQWNAALWRQGGLSVTPACNLVSNLGFDPRATHTRKASSRYAAVETSALGGPIASTPIDRPACDDAREDAVVALAQECRNFET